MKLKRLRLIGFKTFADKTEIEFSDGITAIVGPNGCGKSNVADAILWVLGEQNPRLLRGSETRDFIFAGSDRRKPVGMAEVELLIDNTDGSLPLEFSEIAVARRIYRSGESRYTINGSTCRLKDIVDLFLDTGMGRGAYSFVGQNEVDAVLSARPEDRRELFDEAAGVQKYRTRKREALRKLEVSELNLTRVNDIVAELERQREPLREQAELAERYLAALDRIRQVEADVLVAEAHRYDYELYVARKEREECIARVAQLDEALARLEHEAAEARSRLAQAEKDLNEALATRQAAANQTSDLEHRLQLTSERLSSTEQGARDLDARLQQVAEREHTLAHTLERERRALNNAEITRASLEEALQAAREKYEKLADAVRHAEEIGRDRDAARRQLQTERAARQSALTVCRTRLEECRTRRLDLQRELEQQTAAVAECQARFEAVRSAVARASQEETAATELHREATERLRKAEDARERVENQRAAKGRLATERSARLQALEEMQAAGEGLFQGVRAVLQAAREGELPADYVTLADVLTVPDRLRRAIDVALGSGAQSVVCSTRHHARTAIEWLKTHRKGRATFLPLDSLDPPDLWNGADLRTMPGALGVAACLVECEDRYRPAMALMLNRVLVFEDMDSALDAARQLRGWSRIVTLGGELLTPGGAVTGGEGPGTGPQLIRRKGEMDDLRAETAKIRRDLEMLEKEVAVAHRDYEKAVAEVNEASERLARASSHRELAEKDLQNVQRELAAHERRAEDLAAQIRRLEETAEALSAEVLRWEEAVRNDTTADADLDDEVEKARQEAARYRAEAGAARDEVTRYEVELSRILEQARALRRNMAVTEKAIEDLRRERKLGQQQREALGRRLAELETQRQELQQAREEAARHLEVSNRVYEERSTERSVCVERTFALSGAIQEATTERAKVMSQLHEADLTIARLEIRLAQCAERLSEEYGMTLEEAIAASEPTPPDRQTVQEVARLRRELKAMGHVNTGAVEEYRRLTERYEFLCAQRADLQNACASLRETIAEIDRNTRSVFLETFHAVEKEFQQLFTRLFGGGETRLVLTDPENILETGVEVLVRPPGKRVQSLALLSGGERTLTAVALLFSFMAVRPSPFVVLDEVDAALDGANIERFGELLQDFARDTQFLVITHNPATIERASRWYGVTMPEPGVSRIIAYRPDWATDATPSASPSLRS